MQNETVVVDHVHVYHKRFSIFSNTQSDLVQAQNFLNTLDGRKGWASWPLNPGYIVYLLNQTCQSRSTYRSWIALDYLRITVNLEASQAAMKSF